MCHSLPGQSSALTKPSQPSALEVWGSLRGEGMRPIIALSQTRSQRNSSPSGSSMKPEQWLRLIMRTSANFMMWCRIIWPWSTSGEGSLGLWGQRRRRYSSHGRLPLDQSLKYAGQVGDALDAAHRKDITNRYLKPVDIRNRSRYVSNHGKFRALPPREGKSQCMNFDAIRGVMGAG